MLSVVLNVIDVVNKIKLRETALPVLYFHRVLAADCDFCPDDWQASNFELLIEKLTKTEVQQLSFGDLGKHFR